MWQAFLDGLVRGLFFSSGVCNIGGSTGQYDALYAHYSADRNQACLLKSVAITESSERAVVRSSAGARGLLQLTPIAVQDIKQRFGVTGNPDHPVDAVRLGSIYLNDQISYWVNQDVADPVSFGLASYNAGQGNIRKAWKLSNRQRAWKIVETFLPLVTGAHSVETINYVARVTHLAGAERIGRLLSRMLGRRNSKHAR